MSIAVNNFKTLVKGNPIDKIIQAINFLQPNSIEELKKEYNVSTIEELAFKLQ